MITERARELISKKVFSIIKELEKDIGEVLKGDLKTERGETDLRWYSWVEETGDVSRTENTHIGTSVSL